VSIDMVKLRRWERLIPKLTMKRPMYDNILMYDPDGGLLCSISLKKAHWYVRKDLGEWQDGTQSSVRLRFRPNKDGTEEEEALDSYNQSLKQNQCVACGRRDQGYMRFYIVPYCYRTHFPTSHKSHMPHDVVLLCPACQIPAQRASQHRQTQLERGFANGAKYRTNPQIRHLRKLAGALRRPGLPPNRRDEYADALREFLGTDEVSREQIEAVVQLEEKVLNPDYVSPSELLVKSLLTAAEGSSTSPEEGPESSSNVPRSLEALERFVREWRLHFVATMRPGHLPHGWSVDSPVRCQGSSSVSSSATAASFCGM
jgi:hypothetical protein